MAISRMRGFSVRSVNIRSVLRHPDLSANAYDDGGPGRLDTLPGI